jgi:hypothetical protein
MSSLSISSFGMLEAFKSSLHSLWLGVKHHETLSISVIISLIVLYAARYLTSPYRKLPPGPRGYPIIGNVFDLGEARQWLKFSEWHKKYGQFVLSNSLFSPFLRWFWPGDLTYLNVAGQSVVIINSQKVAVELLDRRAAIYSDRARNIVATEFMTGDSFFAFARYGDR